jgi:hypothetical protein
MLPVGTAMTMLGFFEKVEREKDHDDAVITDQHIEDLAADVTGWDHY